MEDRPIYLKQAEVGQLLAEGEVEITRPVRFRGGQRYLHEELGVAYPDGGGNWVFWDSDSPGLAEFTQRAYPNGEGVKCPWGKAGEKRWVKEVWTIIGWAAGIDTPELNWAYRDSVVYKAGCDKPLFHDWRPSVSMPRWASRFVVKVVEVRPEKREGGWVWRIKLERQKSFLETQKEKREQIERLPGND